MRSKLVMYKYLELASSQRHTKFIATHELFPSENDTKTQLTAALHNEG